MFYSKQIENLEQLSDTDANRGSSEQEEQIGVDKDPEDPLGWRIRLIERAAARIKRLRQTKLDVGGSYHVGDLVFDDRSKRFGRVRQASPGCVELTFLSGDQVVYRQSSSSGSGAQVDKKKAVAPVLGAVKREALAVGPVKSTPGQRQLRVRTAVKRAAIGIGVPQPAAKKRIGDKKKTQAVVVKNAARVTRSVVTKVIKKPIAKVAKQQKGLLSVQQRDAYIQANYPEMSNRELAGVTALSEHTIRRKLGEWGLRRSST